jgi:hypothetical protein
LQGFQLAQGAKKGALDASLVAAKAIEFRLNSGVVEEFGGGEAVLARVLGRLCFTGFCTWSGAELGICGVC